MPRSPVEIGPRIIEAKERMAVWLIIFFGLALRLFGIVKKELWFDELLTNNFTYRLIDLKAHWRGSPETSFFLYKLTSDPISVLYSVAVYIYSLVFGSWESLRYLSAIFSTLSLIIFYKLSRQFLSRKESICALIIMVLNPFQIWYAQEAREYALTCFLSIALVYLYTKALNKRRLSDRIYFSIAGILCIYSSYYFLFILIVCGLVLFFRENRKFITEWLLPFSIILIAALALLPVFLKIIRLANNDFWLRAPNLKSPFLTFGVLGLGYSAGLGHLIAGIILFTGLFIYGAYSLYKCCKKETVALLLFLLFPIFLVFIISKTIIPIYLDRKFIICAPFFYLFLAKGITSIGSRFVKTGIIIIALFLTLSSLFNYYNNGFMLSRPDGTDFYEGVHFKKNYSELMERVIQGLDKDTAICATDAQSLIISVQYLVRKNIKDTPRIYYFLFYPDILDTYQKAFVEMNKIRFINSPEEKDQLYCTYREYGNGSWVAKKADVIDKFEKIWLISSAWNKEGPFLKNSVAVRQYMTGKYKRSGSYAKDGFFIELYAKNKPD